MPYKYQTHQGMTKDPLVDAGAEGSLHSKLRRLSLDTDDSRILLLRLLEEMIHEMRITNAHLAALSGEMIMEA